MNTFFRTFFTCLIIALAFLAYKFVSDDSYSTSLNVSKENPVFGNQNSKKNPKSSNEDRFGVNIPSENKETKEKPQETQKYIHTCYFYGANGDLMPIKRKMTTPVSIENTITLLLKGPTISESKKGIHTDIPANVDLISVKKTEKSVIINLSSNFGNGGGSESVENRVRQLSKTVKNMAPGLSVYLYIDGKEVEYLGGDGVFIKQPLE